MNVTATASLLRNINRSVVLELVRKHSPISRSEIGRQLDMSLPTVMRIVEDLMEEDLVRFSDDAGQSTGGRPPSLVEFKGEAYAVVGVDLGGTKMFGTVADLSGNIQHELYVPHEKENGPEDYVEGLCEMIEELLDAPRPPEQEIRGVGIGAPGVTLVPEGVVTWAPSLKWRDLPLQDILNERFAVPVFVENDVNLAALGEFGFGAGRGVQSLVSIAVGTGIGAGIIVGGALYRGHNQAAGEICYMLPGTEYLGRRYDRFGALESLASATGVVERARQLMMQEGEQIPQGLSAKDVFDAARRDDPLARKVVDDTIDYLSLAVVNVSAALDPEVIILGGGVSRSADLLIEPILQRIDGSIPFVPKIVASPLGRRAAVMGAIMFVLNLTTERFAIRKLP